MKKNIIKVLVVIILLMIAIAILKIAPNYIRDEIKNKYISAGYRVYKGKNISSVSVVYDKITTLLKSQTCLWSK